MKRLLGFIVSMALLLSPVGSAFAQVDAETALTRVNGMLAKERMDALVAGARKEGALEWYGSLQVADVKDLIERFKKRYPFIEVQYTRGGGTNVVSRVLTERKAGADKADVMGGRGNFHHTLMTAGLVAKNLAPLRKEIRGGFYGRPRLLSRPVHL